VVVGADSLSAAFTLRLLTGVIAARDASTSLDHHGCSNQIPSGRDLRCRDFFNGAVTLTTSSIAASCRLELGRLGGQPSHFVADGTGMPQQWNVVTIMTMATTDNLNDAHVFATDSIAGLAALGQYGRSLSYHGVELPLPLACSRAPPPSSNKK
jgi:hypothetical protein